MAIRNLLHANHLDGFSKWLTDRGWELEKPKGDFEVLRARKEKMFLPVYLKYNSDHLSVEDKFDGLIKAFLRQR